MDERKASTHYVANSIWEIKKKNSAFRYFFFVILTPKRYFFLSIAHLIHCMQFVLITYK